MSVVFTTGVYVLDVQWASGRRELVEYHIFDRLHLDVIVARLARKGAKCFGYERKK
jgi:hypothetical protein